jgi:very-short-patch-repair endonuclease
MPSQQRRQSSQHQLALEHRAQHMRQHQTFTEQRLWAELRGGRFGVTFRRQVVIGRFIADFACSAARLVVEVDGGIHLNRARLDSHRDELFRREG